MCFYVAILLTNNFIFHLFGSHIQMACQCTREAHVCIYAILYCNKSGGTYSRAIPGQHTNIISLMVINENSEWKMNANKLFIHSNPFHQQQQQKVIGLNVDVCLMLFHERMNF